MARRPTKAAAGSARLQTPGATCSPPLSFLPKAVVAIVMTVLSLSVYTLAVFSPPVSLASAASLSQAGAAPRCSPGTKMSTASHEQHLFKSEHWIYLFIYLLPEFCCTVVIYEYLHILSNIYLFIYLILLLGDGGREIFEALNFI